MTLKWTSTYKVKEHQNINCMTGNLNKQNGDDNKQQTD
jgi:hypothetical protein